MQTDDGYHLRSVTSKAVPALCPVSWARIPVLQMVWNTSTEVGCGFTACDTGMNMWACEYYPPGNIMGSYPY